VTSWYGCDLHDRIAPKNDAFLWSPAEFDTDMARDTSRGLANIEAIWGIWLDCGGGDLQPHEFAAMFPYLTMVMYNSASSTKGGPAMASSHPDGVRHDHRRASRHPDAVDEGP
jgi:hypothetical protein